MHTTLKTTAKKHKLTLSGEIGYPESLELWETIQHIAQDPKDTTVDWSNLSRLHFSGVQMLFALRRSLEEHHHKLQFSEPNPALYQQLHIFGVWDALIES